MKLINQSAEILSITKDGAKTIEIAGRTCYKTENKITKNSAEVFTKMLISRGHNAMLEFGYATVRFITNRGITHELVRHRLCSFAQESTRYVKYNGDMEFIRPVWLKDSSYRTEEAFIKGCEDAEMCYKYLLDNNWRPEQAREVLPNALKTEIVVQANLREWRHIFKQRCDNNAHPQMRSLIRPLLDIFKDIVPAVFDDITY